jgi:hypothetical protein
MPRVKKPAVTKPRITVTTVALTAAEGQVLHRLREEATDRIGRKISASAVLRALVQWAGGQKLDFTRTEIVPRVEHEMTQLRWGRTKARE